MTFAKEPSELVLMMMDDLEVARDVSGSICRCAVASGLRRGELLI